MKFDCSSYKYANLFSYTYVFHFRIHTQKEIIINNEKT